MRRIGVAWLIVLVSSGVFAQDDPFREVNLRLANDVTHMTDRYFTNGLYFDFSAPALNRNPINLIFVSPGSFLKYSRFSITQDFFTPDFKVDENASRPFASYLLFGFEHEALNPGRKLSITSEFQAGLIGENSGGEAIQNWTHTIFPGADVVSWENQIRNDIAIGYRLNIEKQAFRNSFAQVSWSAEGQIGSPFTRATAGLHIKLGKFEDRFAKKGSYDQDWQWYLYGDFRGNAVLHNATIQGGLFADNPYTRADLNPWVFNIETGIGVSFKQFGLELGQHFLTPEFYFGENHMWGYVNLRYRF